MRALRVLLALILTAGPIQAQPVVDLLAHYSIPADETAASAPEGDAPAGSGKQLAALEANLAFVGESLEAFAHPQDADKALLTAKPGLPSGAARFFKDRTSALNALYRTLAVVDYTWALRFPNPTCTPAAKRSLLLRSDDGLFLDPESGRTSAWMTALLGPGAEGHDLEAALDRASATADVSQVEYARLRARLNLLTKSLADRTTRDDARAELYCARAEIRRKLAAANSSGFVLAARSAEEKTSHQGVVIIAGRTAEGLEVRGAGVVIDTKSGIRVLTDRRLGSGEVVALFDGNAVSVELSVDQEDAASGLLLLRPEGDLGDPLTMVETAPKNDDLVFVLSHSDRLGAWTRTEGLVTGAGADQFQSDAVADASMTGGAVLNDEGRLAGVLVLRRDAASETGWPVGIPAPALRAWLDGGRAPTATPVSLTDQGTTKILTASRPLLQSLAVGQGATAAGYEFDTPTPWGNVHARCVANCADNTPQSSYSDDSSRQLGEALGKLAAVGVQALIYKGIPALFRGIGSLFKSKSRPVKAPTANIEVPPEKIQKVNVEPPKPVCTFEPVKLPQTIGAEQAEFGMRFSCSEPEGAPKINLGGHTIIVSVGWKGAAPSTYSITTDAYGYASLPIKVQTVEIAARKAFDDLDKYDPDKKRAPPGPNIENAPADGAPDSKLLFNAANPTDVAPAVKILADVAASAPQTVATIVRDEASPVMTVVIGAQIVLPPVASGVIIGALVIGTFDVGLKIGGGANDVINKFDYKRRHPSAPAKTDRFEDKFAELDGESRKPDENEDCSLKPNEDILARFIDGTRLESGFLPIHERHGGHAYEKHVGKSAEYLRRRLKEVDAATSFNDLSTAERFVRTAVVQSEIQVRDWYQSRYSPLDIRHGKNPAVIEIGYGVSNSNADIEPKYSTRVILHRIKHCKILIYTAYPE